MWPSRTTVAQPLPEIGEAAVDLPVNRPDDGRTRALPSELKCRIRTAAPQG